MEKDLGDAQCSMSMRFVILSRVFRLVLLEKNDFQVSKNFPACLDSLVNLFQPKDLFSISKQGVRNEKIQA